MARVGRLRQVRHLGAIVRRELRALLAERATGGVGHAVRQRVAHHAGVSELRHALDALRQGLDRLETIEREHAKALAETMDGQLRHIEAGERDHATTSAQVVRLTQLTAELEARAGQLGHLVEALGHRVDELGRRLAVLEPLTASVTAVEQRLDAHHTRLEELERALAVESFTSWIAQASLRAEPLISVVMPTYNRAALLPRAVASVQAQAYQNWELLIADDSSVDDTPEVLAAIDDPRVRSLRVPHGGCCAARNAALDVAKGEIVAYLDDDNTMHPLWLKSLAWAFTEHPEVDVLYGAFVIDDVDRVDRLGSGAFPRLFLHPYARTHVDESNVADMGAIAHRAALPQARFDESLVEMGDWDLLCRLTADRDPLVLPAVACFYSTDAPNRLSCGPTHGADYTKIRARNEARQAVHQ